MKGAWFWLNFHTTVKTSLLFYLQFCVRLFPLCIRSLRKFDGNWVQLVVLDAVGTAPPWEVRSV